MQFLVFLSLLFTLIQTVFGLGEVQSTSVRGILKCDGEPAVGVKVKLYDVDTFDPDDLMGETVTDKYGEFKISGHETEVTKIDPKLNIYHKCKREDDVCPQKFSIKIPDDFITQGETPNKIYDAGVLNLAGKFSGNGFSFGQSKDCIN